MSLIVDFLQLYALLWASSLAWPWPQSWLGWSVYVVKCVVVLVPPSRKAQTSPLVFPPPPSGDRWTLYFNLDFVSIGEYWHKLQPTGGAGTASTVHSLWGEHSNFIVPVAVWCGLLLLLPLSYRLFGFIRARLLCDWQKPRAHYRTALLLCFLFGYMPVQLVLVRCFRTCTLYSSFGNPCTRPQPVAGRPLTLTCFVVTRRLRFIL